MPPRCGCCPEQGTPGNANPEKDKAKLRSDKKLLDELVQVGAMAQRIAEDCGLLKVKWWAGPEFTSPAP